LVVTIPFRVERRGGKNDGEISEDANLLGEVGSEKQFL
jgi:hypothetical protein